MIKVRYLGAAGLEFIFQGKTILIDPFISRYTMEELQAGPLVPQANAVNSYLDELQGEIAAVLMGHTHYDHALDMPIIAKHIKGPLVGSQSLETLMAAHDLPGLVTVCKGGETVDLMPGATVTMLLSKHGIIGDRVPSPGEIEPNLKPPLLVTDYKLGTICIAKLQLEDLTFMACGSANFIPEELEGHTCDVLFMGAGGWQKTREYVQQLPAMVKPKVIVPYHTDNFFIPIPEDRKTPLMPGLELEKFTEIVSKSAPDAEIRILDTFQYTEF